MTYSTSEELDWGLKTWKERNNRLESGLPIARISKLGDDQQEVLSPMSSLPNGRLAVVGAQGGEVIQVAGSNHTIGVTLNLAWGPSNSSPRNLHLAFVVFFIFPFIIIIFYLFFFKFIIFCFWEIISLVHLFCLFFDTVLVLVGWFFSLSFFSVFILLSTPRKILAEVIMTLNFTGNRQVSGQEAVLSIRFSRREM